MTRQEAIDAITAMFEFFKCDRCASDAERAEVDLELKKALVWIKDDVSQQKPVHGRLTQYTNADAVSTQFGQRRIS